MSVDERWGCGVVEAVVRSLKEWARRCGLLGTCDGMLNSYAFSLLVLFFLQTMGVLPNLQTLATHQASVLIEGHDTRFYQLDSVNPLWCWEDSAVAGVPTGTVAGCLVFRFFEFYGFEFDWASCAVSVRLARPAPAFVQKAELRYGDRPSWYVEDPFDVTTNLAHGTTAQGRERILAAMRAATLRLQASGWNGLCLHTLDRPFEQLFLKTRLRGLKETNLEKVGQELWTLFQPYGAARLFLRLEEDAYSAEAYVQFCAWEHLRSAQSANEQELLHCSQPVALFISLGYGLFDELERFVLYPMEEDFTVVLEQLTKDFAPLPFLPSMQSCPQISASARGAQGKGLNPEATEFVPGLAFSFPGG